MSSLVGRTCFTNALSDAAGPLAGVGLGVEVGVGRGVVTEQWMLLTILNIAGIDASVAQGLVGLPWIADGSSNEVINVEGWAILYMERLVDQHL